MGKRHDEALRDQLAKRKALRSLGKTRGRPKYRGHAPTLKERIAAYENPIARYQPAHDGTRRGIPNGLPDRFLKPASVAQRNLDRQARRGTLTPYKTIFKL